MSTDDGTAGSLTATRSLGGESARLANERVTEGQVLAAYAMLVMAALNATIPITSLIQTGELSGGILLYAAGLDFFLGGCLVFRIPSVLIWVQIRVVLGIVMFGVVSVMSGFQAEQIVAAVYSGAIALLVFGDPGKTRKWIAMIIIVPFLILSAIGIAMMILGV